MFVLAWGLLELMQRVFVFILFFLCTLVDVNAARVTDETQLFPTSFAYYREDDLWEPTSSAVVSKKVLEELGSIAKQALFTTDMDTLKEAFTKSIPQIPESYQCRESNLKQIYDLLLPHMVRIVYAYMRTRPLSGQNEAEWRAFVNRDQGLLMSLTHVVFYLKSIEATGKDIASFIQGLCSHVVVAGMEPKEWMKNTAAYKGTSKNDYLLDQLNEHLCQLTNCANGIQRAALQEAKTPTIPEVWTAITRHIVDQLVSIPCLTEGNTPAQNWTPDGYVRGLIWQQLPQESATKEHISKLEHLLPQMTASIPHRAMHYYRQSLEISLGMILAVYPELATGRSGISTSMTLGRHMYAMIKKFPEKYFSSSLTHGQVVDLLREMLGTSGFCSDNLEIRREAFRYLFQEKSAQEVVVPLIVLQKLLENEKVQENLDAGYMQGCAQSMFKSNPSHIEKTLEVSIKFLRSASEILIDPDKNASAAEEELAQRINNYADKYQDDSALDNKTAGLIHCTALLFLLQNPEMKDDILGDDLIQRQKSVAILFNNVLSMTKAFFALSSEKGQLVRKIPTEMEESYRQNMLQTIRRLKPIANEISLCRTPNHLDKMQKVYQYLSKWGHFSEKYSYDRLPNPRIITFVDPATGQIRCRVAMTMPMDNPGAGQCWAYSLRTSGEPRVRRLIQNLEGDSQYRSLHVDSTKKYTEDSSAYQVLVSYSPYIVRSTGISILYEEIIGKDATVHGGKADTDTTTLTSPDGMTAVLLDTKMTPRIATSKNAVKHYWMSVDISDLFDIARSMRLFRKENC